MDAYRLKSWEIKRQGDNIRVTGRVYGHPQYQDGMEITTSPVMMLGERSLYTKSGSHYKLDGPPLSGMAKFFREHNITHNNEVFGKVRRVLDQLTWGDEPSVA
jgi:hypothetical protein